MAKKILFVVMAVMLAAAANAKPGKAVKPEALYAVTDTCKTCHEDKHKSYSQTYHSQKNDPRTPAAKNGCETCHGAGTAHAKAGGGKGVGGIVPLSPSSSTPVSKINETCLQCHAKGKTAMWKGSAHESRGLACSTCHDPHGGNAKNLIKPKQAQVCGQCHPSVVSESLKMSHHPVREGKMNCSDCHNPHGTVTDKLISANSVNEKCFECHTEKRGPFLWEHAPATESCLSCHKPHGSSHEKLLVERRPYLCQQCHSNSRHPGTLYAITKATNSVYQVSSDRLFSRACSICHSQIHGSNHPSGKFFAR
ncbi:MAG: DmsE family decaheme c-type cytochrome [Candidatus Margulisiibacteriota bacterium]